MQTDLDQILSATDCLAYEWSLEDDTLKWSGDAARFFNLDAGSRIGSGREYAALLQDKSAKNRYDEVVNSKGYDAGEGIAYQIEYAIAGSKTLSGETLWIEDTGRWYADENGGAIRAVGLVRCNNARHEHLQKLTYLSHYDQQTGLLNREKLIDTIEAALENAARERKTAVLVLACVDNLAYINQAFGYHVGDDVIASVAERLKRNLRNSDSIGRYGGNKFGLVLNDCTARELEVAGERLMESVRESVISTKAGPVSATASMGAVIMPRHAEDARTAMNCAEAALDKSKSRHVDNFIIFERSDERCKRHKRNMGFADDIVAALNNRRVIPAFQPVVDARGGGIAFYECLLRLENANGEIVSGGPLIPLAEQLGLVRLIDHRMLEMAARALAADPDLRLSLNISPLTTTCPNWMGLLAASVGADQTRSQRLIVEITETAALQNIEETSGFISQVRDMGCKVAIDDFGAGYTSFHNLKMLEVDMVKLDGGFIEKLSDSKDDQFFTRTLIDLARNFELETVAEWVTDERTADMLREWGVDFLQGFIYGKPVLRNEFVNPQEEEHGCDMALAI